MRLFFTLTIFCLSLNAYGQSGSLTSTGARFSAPAEVPADSIPSVVYMRAEDQVRQPAMYVNGSLSNAAIMSSITPNSIDSIRVEKGEIEINGRRYSGRIYIKMKDGYNPALISLDDLKEKYTTLKDTPVVFMIDNEVVNEDHRDYLVDEKGVFKIVVDNVEAGNDHEKVAVIRILTRGSENRKKKGGGLMIKG